MRGLDPRRLVFVDETGVTTGMSRTHARAPEGRRAYGTTPAGRWRCLTVPGALAADGVAGAMSIERATDSAVFLAHLDHVLIPELVRTRPDAVVVMDDLSPHQAPAVRRRFEAAGLELILLPRYAPDLNPIEPMWAQGQGGAAGGGAHGRGAGGGPGRGAGRRHGRRRARLLPRRRLCPPCHLRRKPL